MLKIHFSWFWLLKYYIFYYIKNLQCSIKNHNHQLRNGSSLGFIDYAIVFESGYGIKFDTSPDFLLLYIFYLTFGL